MVTKHAFKTSISHVSSCLGLLVSVPYSANLHKVLLLEKLTFFSSHSSVLTINKIKTAKDKKKKHL